MIGLALLVLSSVTGRYQDCIESPASELCAARKSAYDAGDYAAVLELIDREYAAVGAAIGACSEAPTPGELRHLCLPLEAGFVVANERLHDPARGAAFLQRYAEADCLTDPYQRPRYFTNSAMLWRSRLDEAHALRLLLTGERGAWRSWLLHWRDPRHNELLASIANSMTLRIEIAANLRRTDDLRALSEEVADLLEHLDRQGHENLIADDRNLLGWSLLMAREAGVAVEPPTELLLAALETYTSGPGNKKRAVNVQINLALDALQRDAYDECQRWLDDLEAAKLDDEALMWLWIIEHRLALVRGDGPVLIQAQAELDALAERGRVPLAAWFAHISDARSRDAEGQTAQAIVTYQRAERLLEEIANRRLDAGDAPFAVRRLYSFTGPIRRLVSLLVASGDGARALAVVRRARSRALRVAAQQRCGEGPAVLRRHAVGPGELRLFYFPVDAELDVEREWVAFAVDSRGIATASLSLDPLGGASQEELARWSRQLLEPFAAELARATTIEVLPAGALHRVPFHALLFRGQPLIEHASVRYSLDLTPCRTRRPRPRGQALVLHGPEPGLRSEARRIEDALAAGKVGVDVHMPTSSEDLARLLAQPRSILHIAAHGARVAQQSLLETDTRLELGDVVLTRDAALRGLPAPPLVYLSACRSSDVEAESLGGFSLAHAFLLGGADHVVGATGEFDGSVAASFAEAFYRALGEDPARAPEAWRLAYRETARALSPSLLPELRKLRLYAR